MKKILITTAMIILTMFFTGCRDDTDRSPIQNEKYHVEKVGGNGWSITVFEVTGKGEKYLVVTTGHGVAMTKK